MDQFVIRALIGVNSRSAVIEGRGQGVRMLLGGWKRMMSTAATKTESEVAEKNNQSDIYLPPMPPKPLKGKAYVQYYAKMGTGCIPSRYLPKFSHGGVILSDEDIPGIRRPKPKYMPKFDEERAKLGPVFAFYDYDPRKDGFKFNK